VFETMGLFAITSDRVLIKMVRTLRAEARVLDHLSIKISLAVKGKVQSVK
jgi:hypothetical protein